LSLAGRLAEKHSIPNLRQDARGRDLVEYPPAVNDVSGKTGGIIGCEVRLAGPGAVPAPEYGERPFDLFLWHITAGKSDRPALQPARLQERKTEMNWLRNRILQLQVWKDTSGQDLVEYALAAGMVAVGAVAAMPSLSATVDNVFTKIGGIINNNVH